MKTDLKELLMAAHYFSVAQAIGNGNSDPSIATQGDWLAGGEGADLLVGSAARDVLTGGGGTDLLIGGAGDDDLMGDRDWTASSLAWTVATMNGTRIFQPVDGTDFPQSAAGDVIYAGSENGIAMQKIPSFAMITKAIGQFDNSTLAGRLQ